MKIVIKKLFVILFFITTLIIADFSTEAQAKTPYIGDCFGEDVAPECLEEEEESLDLDESEESEQTVLSDQKNTESLTFSIVKTLFALLLILALIYILIKFLSRRNKLFNHVKALENLGGISVGPNKSIQIVRIGGKIFMVGVGDNVELLQEIDDEDLIKDLLHSDEQGDFQVNHLVQSIFNPKSKKSAELNEKSHHKFKNLFSNELEKLKENRLKVKNQQKKKED